jgi:hypothetical protein
MSGIGIGLGIGLSRGGSAPPAWSPADLTPHVWLSAADLSSLYQDGGKTTAVTSDGQSVGSYGDKSGNGHDFSGAGGARPTYQATGVAGRPGVQWDDGDDALTCSPAFCPSGAQTIALVFKLSSVPGAAEFDGLIDLSTGSRSTLFFVCNYAGYTPICFGVAYTGSGAGIGFTWTPDTNAHTLLITYNGGDPHSAASYQAWLDGSPVTLSTTGTFSLSSNASIGNSGAGGYPLGGLLSELVIAPGVVAGADLTELQAYLASKIA